jgi:hypothetical protein
MIDAYTGRRPTMELESNNKYRYGNNEQSTNQDNDVL